jgi:hypothetical protein
MNVDESTLELHRAEDSEDEAADDLHTGVALQREVPMGKVSATWRRTWGIRPGELRPPVQVLRRE